MKKVFPVILLLLSTPAYTNAKERRGLRKDGEQKDHEDDDRVATLTEVNSTLTEDKSTPAEAIGIDEFAMIDTDVFEWVNPAEIQANSTTCGFLKSDLGSLPNVIYPKVMVYVCVQFALNQPAPKGNLAVHCGGPGSLSNCLYQMGGTAALGEENMADYNVIAFDQVRYLQPGRELDQQTSNLRIY
jgi:hypothetical protein